MKPLRQLQHYFNTKWTFTRRETIKYGLPWLTALTGIIVVICVDAYYAVWLSILAVLVLVGLAPVIFGRGRSAHVSALLTGIFYGGTNLLIAEVLAVTLAQTYPDGQSNWSSFVLLSVFVFPIGLFLLLVTGLALISAVGLLVVLALPEKV